MNSRVNTHTKDTRFSMSCKLYNRQVITSIYRAVGHWTNQASCHSQSNHTDSNDGPALRLFHTGA